MTIQEIDALPYVLRDAFSERTFGRFPTAAAAKEWADTIGEWAGWDGPRVVLVDLEPGDVRLAPARAEHD